jgi:hypothetical protein
MVLAKGRGRSPVAVGETDDALPSIVFLAILQGGETRRVAVFAGGTACGFTVFRRRQQPHT